MSGSQWKWTQARTFKHPPHEEWDLIQWDLEDELTRGPRKIASPVYEEGGEWWYLKTKTAPGLSHLPALIVLFRITREPSETAPGIIEGWEAWADDDIVEDLMRRLRGRPAF